MIMTKNDDNQTIQKNEEKRIVDNQYLLGLLGGHLTIRF